MEILDVKYGVFFKCRKIEWLVFDVLSLESGEEVNFELVKNFFKEWL